MTRPLSVAARDVAEGFLGALGMVLAWATPMLRDYRSGWGLDPELATRPLPGDARVREPRWQWTHGIEIDAPPAEVWPWVAQIGQERGGFYSYEFLENLMGCQVDNADRVHPEWQQVALGSTFRLHPTMPPFEVAEVEEGRYFLAYGAPPHGERVPPWVEVSWLFLVEPLDGGLRTRFVSRFRSAHSDELATRLAFGRGLLEPVGFVMDRRMLLGLKERAERGDPS